MMPDEWVVGGPSWLDTTYFDVEAKAENASSTQNDLRLMLQTLLKGEIPP
jgi:uncharacterized protein (TIGR03435 family)